MHAVNQCNNILFLKHKELGIHLLMKRESVFALVPMNKC